MSDPRVLTLEDLRSTGLLWLINTTVFHPRGYALGVQNRGETDNPELVLLGDGSEPWRFSVHEDQLQELFDAVNETLKVWVPEPSVELEEGG